MKVLLIIGLVCLAGTSFATETMGEKAQAVAKDVKRGATEKIHRLEEAACMESDAKCLALKAKNRIKETAETTKDKAVEFKNAMTD